MIKLEQTDFNAFPFLIRGIKVHTGFYSKKVINALETLFDVRLARTRFYQGSEVFKIQEFVDYDIEVLTTGYLARKYGLTNNENECIIKRVFREPDGEVVFFTSWTGYGYWNLMKYIRLRIAEWLCEFGQNDENSIVMQKLCSAFLEPLHCNMFNGKIIKEDDAKWMTDIFDINFLQWEGLEYTDIIGQPCNPFETEMRKEMIAEFAEASHGLMELDDSLNSITIDKEAWNELYGKSLEKARKYIVKIDSLYKKIVNLR